MKLGKLVHQMVLKVALIMDQLQVELENTSFWERKLDSSGSQRSLICLFLFCSGTYVQCRSNQDMMRNTLVPPPPDGSDLKPDKGRSLFAMAYTSFYFAHLLRMVVSR